MTNELLVTLFSWACFLSGYSGNSVPPVVDVEEHSFFVERACNGVECHVLGWFPGTGNTIYLDSSLHPDDSTFDSSIVVHEFVHYLQSINDDRPDSCDKWIAWEREAYNVQRKYIEVYGDYIPIGFTLMDVRCE